MLAAGAVFLVAWCWKLWQPPMAVVGTGNGDVSVGTQTDRSVNPTKSAAAEVGGATTQTLLDREDASSVEGILELVLVQGTGSARASVARVHGKMLAELQFRLSPYPMARVPESSDVLSCEVDTRTTFAVPEGAWTWLRVLTEAGRVMFEAVPPFRGHRVLEVDLMRRPMVFLRVVDAGHLRARAGAVVKVLHSDPWGGDGGVSGAARSVQCDARGEAVLVDLPRGRHLFLAGDATPGEGAPSTASLLWSGEDHGSDALVVLAEPAPRQEFVVTALVERGPLSSPSPKLVLRCIDEPQQPAVPQVGTLRTGPQAVTFRCPKGVYEMDVLPLGSCHIDGDREVEVGDREGTATVVISAQQPRTHVTFRGIGSEDYPVRVSLQKCDRMRNDDPELEFVGPLHWGIGGALIPALKEKVLVLVLGRSRSFVSACPVSLAGEEVEVEVRPATCLRVDWALEPPPAGDSPVLFVEQGAQSWGRMFERRTVLTPAGLRPALVATVVVPAGPALLQVMRNNDCVWTDPVVLGGRFLGLQAAARQ